MSKFYGFNCLDLPSVQRIALETNVPRLVAKQELEDAMAGRLSIDAKRAYELAMRVHADQDIAEGYRNAVERSKWTT